MKRMTDRKISWMSIPPWIIVGALMILVPIFVFWTAQNIRKQKQAATFLMLEKGAALIRSLEAGARTGMMGMGDSSFQFQRLLIETAQQPDIDYLIVTDLRGVVVAHNVPEKIGSTYGRDLDLAHISRSEPLQWRIVDEPEGADTFEVFRRFSPRHVYFRGHHGRMMSRLWRDPMIHPEDPQSGPERVIFVGLDMGPIEAARKADARHTAVMASILLLIGFAAIVSLFLAQAYRSARTSLTRIKAFSDTVVENMPIGLLTLDPEGKITSFNQTAEAVLRRSSGEVVGKRANDILPEQLWKLIDQRKNKRDIIQRDMDCVLGGGKTVSLEASVSSLFGDSGELLGDVLLFRDLTEVQELKREVERNRRLASIGRLAAGVAHEIRNPLSSIKGFATYFKERYREVPEDQKTAEIMVQEVERLNRVIGQLLEFARPVAIIKKPTSLETLIKHSIKMVEGQARAKGIKTTTSFSPGIKDAFVDPDKISQVLLNLYLNAVEAMDQGGRLSVSLDWDEHSQIARITVTDTGEGIRKEDLAHVFDPYFTTKESGTGLGLAIVHNIIESHSGEIRVESEQGKGTSVTILLPVSTEDREDMTGDTKQRGSSHEEGK
ncbi:MAG: PAS domain-containing protein [Deltaproteobacteria bacterium]|nr:MAG: PAS domain-containing protein [Deltaproteobacteria bacterium]